MKKLTTFVVAFLLLQGCSLYSLANTSTLEGKNGKVVVPVGDVVSVAASSWPGNDKIIPGLYVVDSSVPESSREMWNTLAFPVNGLFVLSHQEAADAWFNGDIDAYYKAVEERFPEPPCQSFVADGYAWARWDGTLATPNGVAVGNYCTLPWNPEDIKNIVQAIRLIYPKAKFVRKEGSRYIFDLLNNPSA